MKQNSIATLVWGYFAPIFRRGVSRVMPCATFTGRPEASQRLAFFTSRSVPKWLPLRNEQWSEIKAHDRFQSGVAWLQTDSRVSLFGLWSKPPLAVCGVISEADNVPG